jgi:hypothetical protein
MGLSRRIAMAAGQASLAAAGPVPAWCCVLDSSQSTRPPAKGPD